MIIPHIPTSQMAAGHFEPVLTIKAAANATGLKYWLLLRAVNSGDIPAYQFGNRRRRVRLSDIEAAMVHVASQGIG
jgi:excisionase family DNA binding protein